MKNTTLWGEPVPVVCTTGVTGEGNASLLISLRVWHGPSHLWPDLVLAGLTTGEHWGHRWACARKRGVSGAQRGWQHCLQQGAGTRKALCLVRSSLPVRPPGLAADSQDVAVHEVSRGHKKEGAQKKLHEVEEQ